LRFYKVIAKIEGCNFLPHSVHHERQDFHDLEQFETEPLSIKM